MFYETSISNCKIRKLELIQIDRLEDLYHIDKILGQGKTSQVRIARDVDSPNTYNYAIKLIPKNKTKGYEIDQKQIK